MLTGGPRVGKTSLKHYLLYNTVREDITSTGVLEAPEVATIAEDGDTNGTTDRLVEYQREEKQKMEGQRKGSQGEEGQGKGSQGEEIQGKGNQGDEGQGKGSQGEEGQGNGTQGEEGQGKGSQGEEGQGKGSQGEEGQGKGSQEEEGQGKGSQEEEGQGKGSQGEEGQGKGSQGEEGQGKGSQGEEGQGKGSQGEEKERYDFIKCLAVGSSWRVLTDKELGQLISKVKMEKREVFPGGTLEAPPASLPQASSIDTTLPGDITKTTEVASETTKLPADVSNSPPPPSHRDDTTKALAVQDPLELLQQARDRFLLKHKLSTEAEFDEKKCTFIYLLDTGGQPSFQNVLPLLLDFPCNFLHVFKASERLTDPYVNAFCRDGATEEKRANSRSTWELMKESITAAYTMSMKSKRQLKAFDMPSEPQLHIFLVGTHLSHLPEDPEAKRALLDHNKKVLEEMDNKPYDGNRVFPPETVVYEGAGSYFLLDSQLQGDSKMKDHTCKVVNALRSQLAASKNQLALKVPKVWFCLQLITSSVKKKMWKFTELKEFCLRCQFIQPVDADGQLLALLNLFHCLGFYLYFDLSEYKEQWICTDATFLYKEMSKVLSVQYGPSKLSHPELRIFKKTGEIPEATSEDLFQQLGIDADIPTRWLLEVLVKIGIAAKVREKETRYFIPAALPERQIQLSEASVATLGFAFSFHSKYQHHRYSCIPTGLFHRLAVDIASGRQALKEEEMSPVQLRGKQWRYCTSKSDTTQFIFSQESAHIILSQKEDLIQLQLLVPQHFPKLSLSLTELCRHIRREVYERICHVSKAVFGAEFLEEKATLENGVVCCLKNCIGSSLHLLRFETDSQVTGVCTRLDETKPLTPRESIWVTTECINDTSSVSLYATCSAIVCTIQHYTAHQGVYEVYSR